MDQTGRIRWSNRCEGQVEMSAQLYSLGMLHGILLALFVVMVWPRNNLKK
jgi:hypothetical protein